MDSYGLFKENPSKKAAHEPFSGGAASLAARDRWSHRAVDLQRPRRHQRALHPDAGGMKTRDFRLKMSGGGHKTAPKRMFSQIFNGFHMLFTRFTHSTGPHRELGHPGHELGEPAAQVQRGSLGDRCARRNALDS